MTGRARRRALVAVAAPVVAVGCAGDEGYRHKEEALAEDGVPLFSAKPGAPGRSKEQAPDSGLKSVPWSWCLATPGIALGAVEP